MGDALQSIAQQTHRELEIIAIDDGSTDGTAGILEHWAGHDSRIRILTSPTNSGLIASLNRGLEQAAGSFIARMDADDIAAPARIAEQVRFLEAYPHVDVVGTGTRVVDSNSLRRVAIRPVRCFGPDAVRFVALFATPVAHMTVCARAAVLKAYRYGGTGRALHTEDYELWSRMLADGVTMANMAAEMVVVRADSAGVSRSHETIQVANFMQCAHAHLQRVTGHAPAPAVHGVLVNRMDGAVTARDYRDGLRLLARLASEAAATSPSARADIGRAASLQAFDIHAQALIRGSSALRLGVAGRSLDILGLLARPYVRRYGLATARALPARLARQAKEAGGRARSTP